jgi:hypothetical protein
MPTVAMSGADSIKINGRILADLADGDVVALTYPNDFSNVKTGKNGNSIYGLNESGKQAEAVIRVVRGSADDKFLNSLISSQRNNFAGFVLLTGEFVKRLGDGTGNIAQDTYILSGGIFSKLVEAKSNVEGDTEQSISMYHLKFSNAPRAIT